MLEPRDSQSLHRLEPRDFGFRGTSEGEREREKRDCLGDLGFKADAATITPTLTAFIHL